MTYKLTLNGNEYSPIEWADTEFTAEWVDNFFIVSGDQSLTFDGEAYEYLRELFNANYCAVVDARVYIDDVLTHQGFVYLSEIQWDLIRCTANCAVSDNGYLAIIENKKDQKFYLRGGRDSSNNQISIASSVEIDFHNVTTGASEGTRICYTVHEAFRYVIEAMTDGEIGFVSDYFEDSYIGGGPQFGLVLVNGEELVNPLATIGRGSPNVSYADLWDSLNRLHNLRGALEEHSGQLVVRIEPYSYWQQAEPGIFINQVSEYTERADADALYSTIKAGSSKFRQRADVTPNLSYPDIGLITWDEATYGIVGSCVTSNALELSVTELVYDSNSIENALNGNEDNIRDVFLVETNLVDTLQYDIISDGNYYYNQGLNNQTVIGRWSERIHNSAIFNNGSLFGAFEASLTSDTALWDFAIPAAIQPDYDNVISDPGSDYNPASLTGTYTLPVAGLYIVRASFRVEVTWRGLSPASVSIQTFLVRTLVDYEERTQTLFNPNTTAEQVSTVIYDWVHVFGVEGLAGETLYLVNEANSPIEGLYKADTRWSSTTLLTEGTRVPIVQNASAEVCLSDYRNFLADIKKPVRLKGQFGYVRRLLFRPFGTSEIEVEYIRNS